MNVRTLGWRRSPTPPVLPAAVGVAVSRGLRVVLLAASIAMVGACQPGGGTDDADAVQARDAAQASEEGSSPVPAGNDFWLIDQIQGVWATTISGNSGGSETVFMLGHVVDLEMEIARNGVRLDLQSEDVDTENGTATFRFRGSRSKEQLTFAQVPAKGAGGEGFALRATYADGSHDDLSFVRRLGKQGVADLDAAVYERTSLQTALGRDSKTYPSTRVDCDTGADSRARTVCNDTALKALDLRLTRRFAQLHASGADIQGSRAAALKQLDACGDTGCMTRAYVAWLEYLRDFDSAQQGGAAQQGGLRGVRAGSNMAATASRAGAPPARSIPTPACSGSGPFGGHGALNHAAPVGVLGTEEQTAMRGGRAEAGRHHQVSQASNPMHTSPWPHSRTGLPNGTEIMAARCWRARHAGRA